MSLAPKITPRTTLALDSLLTPQTPTHQCQPTCVNPAKLQEAAAYPSSVSAHLRPEHFYDDVLGHCESLSNDPKPESNSGDRMTVPICTNLQVESSPFCGRKGLDWHGMQKNEFNTNPGRMRSKREDQVDKNMTS